jgi:hypothetical protein
LTRARAAKSAGGGNSRLSFNTLVIDAAEEDMDYPLDG